MQSRFAGPGIIRFIGASRRTLFVASAAVMSVAFCVSSAFLNGSAASAATSKPTGKPIVLFTVATPSGFPGVGVGMKAAAKAINAKGGVKSKAGGVGRPISIVVCDDSAGSNASANCGREAIADHALAVVGSQSANGAVYEPIVYGAGIPVVAEGAYDVPALTNKLSFPIVNSLADTAGGGFPFLASALGVKKVYVVVPNLPQATSLLGVIATQEKAAGVTQVGQSLINTSATSTSDYTPYAAAAASSGAGMIYVDIGPGGVQFAQALLDQGVNFKKTAMSLDTNVVSAQNLKPLGSKANGIYFIGSSYPSTYTSNAGVVQYDNEMNAYGSKSTPRTEASMQAWVGVHIIANLLAKAPTISSAALISAMNNAGPLQYGPTVPFNWSKPAYTSGFLASFRIFSNQMMITRVVNRQAIPIVKGFIPTNQSFTVSKAGKLTP